VSGHFDENQTTLVIDDYDATLFVFLIDRRSSGSGILICSGGAGRLARVGGTSAGGRIYWYDVGGLSPPRKL
jgi:hypothetical protein